jgi:hypothetical protein
MNLKMKSKNKVINMGMTFLSTFFVGKLKIYFI